MLTKTVTGTFDLLGLSPRVVSYLQSSLASLCWALDDHPDDVDQAILRLEAALENVGLICDDMRDPTPEEIRAARSQWLSALEDTGVAP